MLEQAPEGGAPRCHLYRHLGLVSLKSKSIVEYRMNFAIRIDGSYDETKEKLMKFAECCDKVVIYEHPATQDKMVHIHGLCFGYTKKEDTARNFLKTITKKSYELKQKIRPREKNSPPVNEDYIIYMSKGKYEPVLLKGWSSEFILEQKAKGYDKLELEGGKLVIKKGITKTDGKEQRKTRKELIDGIVSDLGEDIFRLSTTEVCRVIRTHLVRNSEVIGMYKVIDIYDSVMMYGNQDKWIDMISSKIESRTKIF